MKNVVKVQLAGRDYNLTSNDSPEYTKKLAEELNARFASIIKLSSGITNYDAAMLCALDSLDELKKANANIENIRTQIKDYVDDAGKARLQADEAQKELRTLRARVAQLEEELKKRNTVVRDENDEVVNAGDIISQEIKDVLDSPVHKQEEKRPAVKPASDYIGSVNYNPNK